MADPFPNPKISFPTVAPSILAADFSQLSAQIKLAAEGGAKVLHCDVMDGHFVPNISFGPMVIEAVRKDFPELFLDVHLMIENPDHYIDAFVDAGSNLITVHIEVDRHINRTLSKIREAGLRCGVAINPGTSLSMLDEVLNSVDLVCVMSVNPGFGGQAFIPSTINKIKRLVEWRKQTNAMFAIEVDGGVSLKNAEKLTAAGTDILVAGSSVFNAEEIPHRVRDLFQKAIIGNSERV